MPIPYWYRGWTAELVDPPIINETNRPRDSGRCQLTEGVWVIG